MRHLAAAVLALSVATTLGGCGEATVSSPVTAPDRSASPTSNSVPRLAPVSPPVSESLSPTDADQSPSEATQEPAVDVDVTAETLAGYRALSVGVNGFFEKAQQAEEQHPHAHPHDAAAVKALVSYTFPEGVDLVEFSDNDPVCFVGPADTHMVFTEVGDNLRQVLGTGACQDTGGDIVVEIGMNFTDDHSEEPAVMYTAHVVKGAHLVAQIPGFNGFVDLLNAST